MRIILLAAALLLTGCASRPQQPAPTVPMPAPAIVRTSLVGLTAAELIQRLGPAALQVREGPGLKLQFRGRCVLDAYLYPPANAPAPERVAHVDTRLATGIDTDPAACIAALQTR